MTKQEYEQSRSEPVKSLHHCGNPDQDHLIDEICAPETTEALYAMACRCQEVAG